MLYICRNYFCLLTLASLLLMPHEVHGQETAPASTPPPIHAEFLSWGGFVRSEHECPVIYAKVNGRSYWFALDTGAATSLIRQSVTKEAKLTLTDAPAFPKHSNMADAVVVEQEKPRGVLLSDLVIGQVKMEAPFYVVRDEAMDRLFDNDPSFAGVIGMNLLKETALYLDFDNKRLTLLFGGKVDASELSKLGFDKNKITMPIHLLPDGGRKYGVDMLFNKKPANLFIDTGAAATELYKKPGDLGVSDSALKEETIREINREYKVRSGTVSLSLKDVALGDMVAGFVDDPNPIGEGALGSDFLSRYIVLVDFPAMKMYLHPRTRK